MNQYSNATHCINGHEFTVENTYIIPSSGTRQCKICMKKRQKDYYSKHKETWNRFGKENITLDRLKEILEYNENNGYWRWIVLPNNRVKKRWFNGHLKINPDGYKFYEVRVDGRTYISARLIWFYMTGDWPIDKIDHENRNSLDNRWENLREATNSQNSMNQKQRLSETGYKGVSRTPGGRYISQIKIDNKMKYLGTYDTAQEAYTAYESVAKPLHGEFWYLRIE